MRTREELAWAAGFLEGEGTFSSSKVSRRQASSQIQIAAWQVTREPLDRLVEAIGLGRVRGPYRYADKRATYRYQVTDFEGCQAVIAMLWGWLSSRRRAQARALLVSRISR